MKRQCLYIIMCIFSLLALPGCRDEEAVQTSEGTRTVTVNLGIAMSRVTKGSSVGDGSTPKDMKVWIFNQDNTELVDYYEIENPTFSGSDALGELVNTHERIFELDNSITELNFYVVLNSVSGTGINLSKSSSVNDIQNATFTGLQNVTGDNQVPVYGETTLDVSDHQNSYPVTIETTRAVSKLEMFFTKENASSDLKINRITLENIPDKGLLAREIELADIANYDKTETLFEDSNSNGKEITTDLPASESPVGDFSNHPDDFVQIDLSQAYLLENPNNNEWSPTTGTDYEYPEAAPSRENAYVLTVEYTLNNKEEECSFVLPETKRNIWNKIFVRVNDNGELIIQYKALPWEKVTSGIGYAPQPASTSENPFTEDNYDEFMAGNNYILLPLEKYEDYKTTQALFSYLYNHPEAGDNEARLCIVTRPTYDNSVDEEEHWSLKTGSAGARYLFMLTGPKGATWEAHLDDPDGNFDFSTSPNDEDFADCTDEGFSKEVRMVTHGIARKQPYIIQINATHLYTGYEKGLTGVSEVDEEPRFDSDAYKNLNLGTDKEKWKPYFGDDYLTNWGKDKWENEKVIEAEFYITVKLTDGTEYNLTINPSYEDNTDIEDKNFPFLQKRRFAGDNERIWIRHLRAQYGWQNLEYLARDVDPNASGNEEEWDNFQWWMVNKYWNPKHEWSK